MNQKSRVEEPSAAVMQKEAQELEQQQLNELALRIAALPDVVLGKSAMPVKRALWNFHDAMNALFQCQYLRQNLWMQKKDGFDEKLTLCDPF